MSFRGLIERTLRAGVKTAGDLTVDIVLTRRSGTYDPNTSDVTVKAANPITTKAFVGTLNHETDRSPNISIKLLVTTESVGKDLDRYDQVTYDGNTWFLYEIRQKEYMTELLLSKGP